MVFAFFELQTIHLKELGPLSLAEVLVGFFPACLFLGGILILRHCNDFLVDASWVGPDIARVSARFFWSLFGGVFVAHA